MEILNIQSLIAKGLITDVAHVDPTKAYVAIGVYQPNNRPAGSGNNTYPAYAMPISELLGGSVTGSGTINFIPKWTPSGTALGNSQLFDNGTNIGINTILPTAKVHILGASSLSTDYSLKIENLTNKPILFVTNAQTIGIGIAVPTASVHIHSGNFNSHITYSLKLENSSSSPLLYIDDYGYAGLSVGSPTARLHVQGISSTSADYALKVDNSSSSPLLYVRNDGIVLINSSYNNAQLNVSTPASPSFVNAVFGDATLSNGFGVYGVGNYGVVGYTTTTAYGNGIYGNASSIPYTGVGGYFVGGVTAIIGKSSTADLNSSILQLIDSTSVIKVNVLGSGYVSIGLITPTASLHVKGVDSTSANYALKIVNSSLANILSVKNDLSILFGTNSTYNELSSSQTVFNVSSFDSANSIAIYSDVSPHIDLSCFAGLGSILVDSTTGNFLIGTGTNIMTFNSLNTSINLVNLPVGNAGLSTGDMYVDTAANILANGDKVVGWKV